MRLPNAEYSSLIFCLLLMLGFLLFFDFRFITRPCLHERRIPLAALFGVLISCLAMFCLTSVSCLASLFSLPQPFATPLSLLAEALCLPRLSCFTSSCLNKIFPFTCSLFLFRPFALKFCLARPFCLTKLFSLTNLCSFEKCLCLFSCRNRLSLLSLLATYCLLCASSASLFCSSASLAVFSCLTLFVWLLIS